MSSPGRPKKTGAYSSRKILEVEVLDMYNNTQLTIKQIARVTEISSALVHRIINQHISSAHQENKNV